MHTDCIEGSGRLDKDGYHLVWVPAMKRNVPAHRWAYAGENLTNLYAIQGMVVRHQCHNRRCVNPAHLLTGSQADNVADRVDAGRSAQGTAHGMAELTVQQVQEMRSLYVGGSREYGTYALARRFGVSQRTVWKVVNNVSYREELLCILSSSSISQ